MRTHQQNHLSWKDTINFGSYYTPPKIVENLYSLLMRNIANLENWTIMDTSCGYGAFLNSGTCTPKKYIGADIDEVAIKIAYEFNQNITFYTRNGLLNVRRENYNITPSEPLIIAGNPPYNDTTSIIRNGIKQTKFKIDDNLRARDLGLSFLLSYDKLEADYICVLHPLSYLIKAANFNLLKEFKNNYKLIDSLVFSSSEFDNTSKSTSFPIMIALYKRQIGGMDYNFIKNYNFKTIEGKEFCIGDFDYVSNYITKYPNKRKDSNNNPFALFWTMRDINALKRSRTFIEKDCYNAIHVPKENMLYYCYVDIFKKYIDKVPYYFGNCDIFIDNNEFLKIQNAIKIMSIKHNPVLQKKYDDYLQKIDYKLNNTYEIAVGKYFKKLLGEHYVQN